MNIPTSFYFGLVLYVISLLLIGLYVALRKKTNSIEDMFIGGKSLGGIASFLSAGATFSSGYVYSAMVGAGFLIGWGAYWYMIGDVIGTFVLFILCSKALHRMGSRFNSVTLLDLICDRLEDKKNYLRLFLSLVIVFFSAVYLASQYMAAAQMGVGLGINYSIGLLLSAAIVIIYTMVGGYLAVVYTDVLQSIIMVIALIILPIVGISSLGGWQNLFEIIKTQDPNLLAWHGTYKIPMFIGGILLTMLAQSWAFIGNPAGTIRLIGIKNKGEIKKGALITIIWYMIVRNFCVLTGMVARAIFETVSAAGVQSAEGVYAPLIIKLLPSAIGGFLLAAVFAAIMSTADSHLLLVSSAVVRDIGERSLSLNIIKKYPGVCSKLVVLAVGILGLLLVSVEQTVLYAVWFSWFGIGAMLGPILIYAICWKRFTLGGAWACAITGFLVSMVWNFTPGLKAICHFSFPAGILSFIAGYIGSLLTQPPSEVIINQAFGEEV